MKNTGTPHRLAIIQAKEKECRLDYLLEKLEITLQEIKREFPDVKVSVDNFQKTE
jgi:hypothetical protein